MAITHSKNSDDDKSAVNYVNLLKKNSDEAQLNADPVKRKKPGSKKKQ